MDFEIPLKRASIWWISLRREVTQIYAFWHVKKINSWFCSWEERKLPSIKQSFQSAFVFGLINVTPRPTPSNGWWLLLDISFGCVELFHSDVLIIRAILKPAKMYLAVTMFKVHFWTPSAFHLLPLAWELHKLEASQQQNRLTVRLLTLCVDAQVSTANLPRHVWRGNV